MSRRPLIEKIHDEDYLNNLSNRRKRELLFCSQILSPEELSQLSSIAVAYNIARRKYVEENFSEEEQTEYLIKKKPIFFSRGE
jgi:hypothetical protein